LGFTTWPGEWAFEKVQSVLPSLFPDDKPGSIVHTGRWAFNRLGSLALVALAVSIEDPDVRRPSSYFGKLVTNPDQFNPKDSLKRLRALNPIQMPLPDYEDERIQVFIAVLSDRLGEGAVASYLSRPATRIEPLSDRLRIAVSSRVAYSRLRESFFDCLESAAVEAGFSTIDILDARTESSG
jgi:hypothetical protein